MSSVRLEMFNGKNKLIVSEGEKKVYISDGHTTVAIDKNDLLELVNVLDKIDNGN